MKKEEDKKPFGVASLVLSIIGFVGFMVPYFAIFFSILSIIFAAIQYKRGPSGCGTAGLVVGILGLLGNLMWLVILGIVLSVG